MNEQEQGNRRGEAFVIWLLVTFAFVIGVAVGALGGLATWHPH